MSVCLLWDLRPCVAYRGHSIPLVMSTSDLPFSNMNFLSHFPQILGSIKELNLFSWYSKTILLSRLIFFFPPKAYLPSHFLNCEFFLRVWYLTLNTSSFILTLNNLSPLKREDSIFHTSAKMENFKQCHHVKVLVKNTGSYSILPSWQIQHSTKALITYVNKSKNYLSNALFPY